MGRRGERNLLRLLASAGERGSMLVERTS